MLTKSNWAVAKRSEGELEEVAGENCMKLSEIKVSEFQKKKGSGALPSEFATIDEKDGMHQTITDVEPLLEAARYRIWRSVLMTDGEYPCHCLAQTLWYPKTSELDAGMECGGIILHGITRQRPACIDPKSQCHDRVEVFGNQCWNK